MSTRSFLLSLNFDTQLLNTNCLYILELIVKWDQCKTTRRSLGKTQDETPWSTKTEV